MKNIPFVHRVSGGDHQPYLFVLPSSALPNASQAAKPPDEAMQGSLGEFRSSENPLLLSNGIRICSLSFRASWFTSFKGQLGIPLRYVYPNGIYCVLVGDSWGLTYPSIPTCYRAYIAISQDGVRWDFWS